MINDDITIAKGAYSVGMFTTTSAENFKNTLTVVTGVVSPNNQASGTKDPTVVDLLRITHTFTVECYITKTASKSALQVKKDLIKIFNGADIDSTPADLTYEDSHYDVFAEDLVIKKINNDDMVSSSYTGLDAAEYQVTMTVVEGKLVGQ